MKKQVFLRGLLGFPLGVAMGYIITIIISFVWGQGNYSPCVPSLISITGSEINAVILQAILSGILGSSFAMCSVIWETDWSIAKQTGIYFMITAMVMLPIAYFSNWMKHTLSGFLIYFGVFVVIFIVVWIAQYLFWKNRIKKANAKVEKRYDR